MGVQGGGRSTMAHLDAHSYLNVCISTGWVTFNFQGNNGRSNDSVA